MTAASLVVVHTHMMIIARGKLKIKLSEAGERQFPLLFLISLFHLGS